MRARRPWQQIEGAGGLGNTFFLETNQGQKPLPSLWGFNLASPRYRFGYYLLLFLAAGTSAKIIAKTPTESLPSTPPHALRAALRRAPRHGDARTRTRCGGDGAWEMSSNHFRRVSFVRARDCVILSERERGDGARRRDLNVRKAAII